MAIFKGFATIVKYLRETIGEGIAAYCVSYTLMRSFVLLYKQFTLYKQKVLRILTGTKHRQTKLQRLEKVRILVFRLLVHQINYL